jgi:hypothetical protein
MRRRTRIAGRAGRVDGSFSRAQSFTGIKTAVVGCQPLSKVIITAGTIGLDSYRVISRIEGGSRRIPG